MFNRKKIKSLEAKVVSLKSDLEDVKRENGLLRLDEIRHIGEVFDLKMASCIERSNKENKVYHAADRKEAQNLVGTQVEVWHEGKWVEDYLDFIGEEGELCFIVDKCFAVNLVREIQKVEDIKYNVTVRDNYGYCTLDEWFRKGKS